MLIAAIMLATGCDSDPVSPDPDPGEAWQSFGLEGRVVNQLELQDGSLYAATDQGMHRRSLGSGAAQWESLGLEEVEIIDFTWTADEAILAGVRSQDESAVIYRWEEAGGWEAYQNDFGGDLDAPQIEAITSHPEGRDTVFARGSRNVAKSTDGGASWRSVFAGWDEAGYQAPLIYFDPGDASRIWAGGENALFAPYVLRSTDYGESWTLINIDAGGDNAVYSMVVDPSNDDILIGMEAGIMRSSDDGETWETIFEPESEAYILDMEAADGNVIYAAGSEGGASGGPLAIYRSTDFGESWTRTEHDDGPASSAIQSMVVRDEGGDDVLYLGTRDGVFRYTE